MVNFGPLTAEITRLASLVHPSKFQRVWHLGFITAPTSLNGCQRNFARYLAVSWTGTLYIHFRELFPPNGILPGEKFTLRSPILAALLHGTQAVCVSQTLLRGTRNEMQLSLRHGKVWYISTFVCRSLRLEFAYCLGTYLSSRDRLLPSVRHWPVERTV